MRPLVLDTIPASALELQPDGTYSVLGPCGFVRRPGACAPSYATGGPAHRLGRHRGREPHGVGLRRAGAQLHHAAPGPVGHGQRPGVAPHRGPLRGHAGLCPAGPRAVPRAGGQTGDPWRARIPGLRRRRAHRIPAADWLWRPTWDGAWRGGSREPANTRSRRASSRTSWTRALPVRRVVAGADSTAPRSRRATSGSCWRTVPAWCPSAAPSTSPTPVPRGRLSGSMDYDFAFQRTGKGNLTLAVPFDAGTLAGGGRGAAVPAVLRPVHHLGLLRAGLLFRG